MILDSGSCPKRRAIRFIYITYLFGSFILAPKPGCHNTALRSLSAIAIITTFEFRRVSMRVRRANAMRVSFQVSMVASKERCSLISL